MRGLPAVHGRHQRFTGIDPDSAAWGWRETLQGGSMTESRLHSALAVAALVIILAALAAV
jgi:hypothetical protein